MDSQQQEPLIPHGDRDVHLRSEDERSAAPRAPKSSAAPSLFVYLLTLSAGISGLLFGYDTGVISATLVSIDSSLSDRPLTSLDKSIITSSTALFALLISPFSSHIADVFGRKRVILLADGLFVAGAVLQACGATVWVMVAGRAIVGAAVGAASFVIPLYIAELAPAAYRGRLVTVNILFITLGQVIAYIVGFVFAEYGSRKTGWRWMVGLGALPAAVQSVLVLFMPETPRWLVKSGYRDQARKVIRSVAGGDADAAKEVEATLKSIEIEVREEEETRRLSGRRQAGGLLGWVGPLEELFTVKRNRRALAIACLLQGLQQLCGFNCLMYYSSTIFTLLGFSIPTLTSLVVAITNFVFTVAALLLVDTIGRRRILLYSIPFMVVGLLLSAYGFEFVKLPTDYNGAAQTAPSEQHAALIILFSIMLYVAAYALGLGNVPWMQSELFSLSVRSTGSGIATATNWGANFVVGLTFLPLMDVLTPPWTFALYALVCTVGYGLVWRCYPETTGLSLEEAASLLEDERWGVH
ncbi:general substrate transporter [Coniochaeta ligniaria NRRL 30616]|uniref:General substrate transporter n=1 Tax=Coniochaeta ligniaria NRRL 30616 TaxID=1408157 RepID=A0A1J7II98_9PEZI|nr:general substrate transporter [Coniochaeta ligniaria NRRL 30616]